MKKRLILTALTAALLVSVTSCSQKKEKTNADSGDGYSHYVLVSVYSEILRNGDYDRFC